MKAGWKAVVSLEVEFEVTVIINVICELVSLYVSCESLGCWLLSKQQARYSGSLPRGSKILETKGVRLSNL